MLSNNEFCPSIMCAIKSPSFFYVYLIIFIFIGYGTPKDIVEHSEDMYTWKSKSSLLTTHSA